MLAAVMLRDSSMCSLPRWIPSAVVMALVLHVGERERGNFRKEERKKGRKKERKRKRREREVSW